MKLGNHLLNTLRIQYVSLDAWMTRWAPTPVRERTAMAACHELLMAACDGAAPPNGPYQFSFELAYERLIQELPGLVHEMGVSWRRSIPLCHSEQARELLDAYGIVYGSRLLLHSSQSDVLTFARLAYYAAPQNLDPEHFEVDQEWPYDLLELLGAVQRVLGGFSARELGRPSLARELRSLLHHRHYHWVEIQRQIRKETAHVVDKQDHDPSHPLVKEAERAGQDHRQVG